jgi:ATP:corrinoid adenosyltransferase
VSSWGKLELQVLEPKQKVGLIVVLTGHGKGKTTSAMGMVLPLGHGRAVNSCLSDLFYLLKTFVSYGRAP